MCPSAATDNAGALRRERLVCAGLTGVVGAPPRLRPGARRCGSPPLPHAAGAARRFLWDNFWYAGPVPARLVQPRSTTCPPPCRQRAARVRCGGGLDDPVRLDRASANGATARCGRAGRSRSLRRLRCSRGSTATRRVRDDARQRCGRCRRSVHLAWRSCSRRSRSASARSPSCSSACCSVAVVARAARLTASCGRWASPWSPSQRSSCRARAVPERTAFYPFHLVNLVGVLGVSIVGVLLARRAHNGEPILAFFALWGGASIVVSIIGSPIGDNWTRLNEFVFPLMMLTAALARFRPRALVAVALTGALAYNLTPYLLLIPYRLDRRPATAQFWQPAIHYVDGTRGAGIPRRGRPDRRALGVVLDPTGRNRARPRLLPSDSTWSTIRSSTGTVSIRRTTDAGSEPRPSSSFCSRRPNSTRSGRRARRALLRSGVTGLKLVFSDRNWTIYRLRKPTPLITGPGPARVSVFGHTRIGGLLSRPGRYLIRSHYMPFWTVSGRVCLLPAPNGMTWLDAAASGSFSMRASPSSSGFEQAATSDLDGTCRATTTMSAVAKEGRKLQPTAPHNGVARPAVKEQRSRTNATPPLTPRTIAPASGGQIVVRSCAGTVGRCRPSIAARACAGC